eukprot:5682179-Prymnesium_polylepis.1
MISGYTALTASSAAEGGKGAISLLPGLSATRSQNHSSPLRTTPTPCRVRCHRHRRSLSHQHACARLHGGACHQSTLAFDGVRIGRSDTVLRLQIVEDDDVTRAPIDQQQLRWPRCRGKERLDKLLRCSPRQRLPPPVHALFQMVEAHRVDGDVLAAQRVTLDE